MVFGSTPETVVQEELKKTISREMHGTFSFLAHADNELFDPKTSEQEHLLKETAASFSSIVHDLLNIRTTFLRMETLVSVPDIEPNRLGAFLATDVDQFFSYVQSMFDYLSEAIVLLFPYTGRKRVNFANLQSCYQSNYESTADVLVKRLRDHILACDWSANLREIRNQLIHGGAKALVILPLPSDDMFFQIVAGDAPMITRSTFDARLFADQPQSYLSFKAYAGLVLGRLIAFFENVAEIYLLKLSETVTAVSQIAFMRAPLPNVAITIDWIEYSMNRLWGKPNPATSGSSNSPATPSKYEINQESLLSFIDQLAAEARASNYTEQQHMRSAVKIEGFMNMFTNPEEHNSLSSRQSQSIYSFRAECAKRRYKLDSRKHVTELLQILDHVRNDLYEGKIKSYGRIDIRNWKFCDLEMMITPVPALR